MDRDQQVAFIRELVGNVTEELLKDVRAGKLPEDWDGIELRELIALRFSRVVFSRIDSWTRSRKRDFNNTVIVNNL